MAVTTGADEVEEGADEVGDEEGTDVCEGPCLEADGLALLLPSSGGSAGGVRPGGGAPRTPVARN